MADDESVVVVGYREEDTASFLAAKLDADGALLWQWEVSNSMSW